MSRFTYKAYLGDTEFGKQNIGEHEILIPYFEPIEVDYVLVAGGGGGGAGGAGGGAGEVQTSFLTSDPLVLDTATQYEIIVGDGGSRGYAETGSEVTAFNQGSGSNGEDTMLLSPFVTMSLSLGGGGAAGYYKTNPTTDANRSGSIGGSGGGSGILAGIASGSASGSNGYGNNGGAGYFSGSYTAPHGGGGGASTVGEDGQIVPYELLDTKVVVDTPGAAYFYKTTYFGDEIKGTSFLQTDMVSGSVRPSGSYTYNDITITTFGGTDEVAVKNGDGGEPLIIDWVSYNGGEVGAGGGAGGNGSFATDVINGNGGGTTGGNGGDVSGTPSATSGSQYSGAGGGGGFIDGTFPFNVNDGADGGSGIAVLRYAASEAKFVGGSVSIDGSYIVHTFISSSQLLPIL